MKVFNAGQQVDVPGQVLLDWANATTTYVGESAPGSGQADSAWQIKRITFDGSGNPTKIEWADEGSQINRWDQRASLVYS